MTFVNEKISPTDAQKYDWSLFKAWPDSDPHDPYKWTVDHAKEMFLISLAEGAPDRILPEMFCFHWKNMIIRIDARYEVTKCKPEDKNDHTINLAWNILEVISPEMQKDKDIINNDRDEFFSDIKNAFCAYGLIYSTENIVSIEVLIDSCAFS